MTDAALLRASKRRLFSPPVSPRRWPTLPAAPSQTRSERSKPPHLGVAFGQTAFSSHSKPPNHQAARLPKWRPATTAIFKSP